MLFIVTTCPNLVAYPSYLEPLNYTNLPSNFDESVSFGCINGLKFSESPDKEAEYAVCRAGDNWDIPSNGWDTCVPSMIALQKFMSLPE